MENNSSHPKTRQLIIIGAGGHAVSVADVAMSAGFSVHCFVDAKKGGQKLLGINIVSRVSDVEDPLLYDFAIAVGDNAIRCKVFSELCSQYGPVTFPALIHSSAVVSEFSVVDRGTVIMPKAVVGPNSKVEMFCIINTQASIDHDGLMHSFSSLAPGAITGGAVKIGNRSAIAIGATIKHGIKIGDDVVVGANSYVNKHLPQNTVAYGTPARVARSRRAGDPYL